MEKTLLDSVRSFLPGFVPSESSIYSLRYIFYRKSDLKEDKKNACFTIISDLWKAHEVMFANMQKEEDISSCIVEYICEYDSCHAGLNYLVKEKEKEEK